jgi:hypothetical protein
MTMMREIEVDCPNCGTSNLALVWDTINAQVSPEAKTALLRGEINMFRCQLCERKITIAAPLLYNDMENKFWVWYFPFEFVMNGAIFSRITPDGQLKGVEYLPDDPDYVRSMHYVFDMDELVRYIRFRDVLAEEMRHAAG